MALSDFFAPISYSTMGHVIDLYQSIRALYLVRMMDAETEKDKARSVRSVPTERSVLIRNPGKSLQGLVGAPGLEPGTP